MTVLRQTVLAAFAAVLAGAAADDAVKIPRGRPRINAARTTLVADNGALLRGCVIAHDRESLEKVRQLGCNAVHDYAEGCDLNYPADGSQAPSYRVETIDKAVALTRELGLYYVMTIGNDPGRFNRQWALDFWKFYAPRYKDEPHVIYEIQNEPVRWAPPYNSASADPPGAVEMNAECWKLIRSLAPDTPILVFSYSQTPWDSSKHILDDISLFNRLVGIDAKDIWANTAISFHAYAGPSATEKPVREVLKAGYPMFMTEYYSARWGDDSTHGMNDCELTGFLEEEKVSWLSFLYAPPGMWGLNIADDSRFKSPTERAGILWRPDFGSWPRNRRLVTDKGRAFDVGTWQDGRIASGIALSPTGAKKDDFVLRIREPGWYRMSVSYSGARNAELAFSFAGRELAVLRTKTTSGQATKVVFLEAARGVLRLERRKGEAKVAKIELSPCERGPFKDGVYKIASKRGSLVLASSDGRAFLDDWADDDAHKWEFKNLGAGQYRILTKNGGSLLNRIFFGSDKVNVTPWGWDAPSPDQRWILRPAGNGIVRICPVSTGLDVKAPDEGKGSELSQDSKPFASEDERSWRISPSN